MSVSTFLHHEIQCFIWIKAVLYPPRQCPMGGKGGALLVSVTLRGTACTHPGTQMV